MHNIIHQHGELIILGMFAFAWVAFIVLFWPRNGKQ